MRLLFFALCLVPFFAHGAMGEHLRLTWTTDPSSTINILWSPSGSRKEVVYYDTVDHGTDKKKYRFQSKVSKSTYLKKRSIFRSSKNLKTHLVRLEGLDADTKYYFIIASSRKTSKRYWFKTIHNNPSRPLSFIAGGDSRNNRSPRRLANTIVKKLIPDGVLFGGDMTSSGSASQWKKWFDDWSRSFGDDGRVTPLVVARGNHESSNSMLEKLFGTNGGVYYAMNFGGDLFRAYTLNSESGVSGNQKDWLKKDMSSNKSIKWKFAQYHRPIRPHTRGKSERDNQYFAWAQTFYDYGMNIVSESDSHTVKTTYPVRPSTGSGSQQGFIRDDAKGTIFMGEGCWGAPLRSNNDDKSWTRASGKFNQVKLLWIFPETIELRTIKVANAKDVGQLTEANQFSLPSCLKLWNPENGSGEVVTIGERRSPAKRGSCTASYGISIASKNADVEMYKSTGTINRGSSDLELTRDQTREQIIGLTFKMPSNLAPEDIISAKIRFTAKSSSSERTELNIYGVSKYSLTPKEVSEDSVFWNVETWVKGKSGAAQTTPELSSIVKEMMRRSEYKQNLIFQIDGLGMRRAYSYDGSKPKAAKLILISK